MRIQGRIILHYQDYESQNAFECESREAALRMFFSRTAQYMLEPEDSVFAAKGDEAECMALPTMVERAAFLRKKLLGSSRGRPLHWGGYHWHISNSDLIAKISPGRCDLTRKVWLRRETTHHETLITWEGPAGQLAQMEQLAKAMPGIFRFNAATARKQLQDPVV